jgi:uncharacterized membrane protein
MEHAGEVMMLAGGLVFTDLDRFWPWAGAGLVGLMLLAWSYRVGPPGGLGWVCMGCKALGIGVLVFCLLEPLWSGRRVTPGSNRFAIVVDNSQSLLVADRDETETRADQLRQLLDPVTGGDWQARLAEDFEVRRFLFDTRLRATSDFADLSFDGRASELYGAVSGVVERLAERPLAGVLLFTDGNATDALESLGPQDRLPPVYPVVLGRAGAVRDLALVQVSVSQTAFEDAPIAVRLEVGATGCMGEEVVAQWLDDQGRVLEAQTRRVRRAQETLAFRFGRRMERAGLAFYQVRVGLRSDVEDGSRGAGWSEATAANNARTLAVDVGRGPHRILYVSGRPNWEFKFLNRALLGDDTVQLVGLLRIARREPKFEFRGRGGESSNPLFRGFGTQSPEEVERYDQPVLVRLGTRDELELQTGFPAVAEDLFGYQAVILDDVEAAFFSAEQAQLLQRFVSERGGGFLMLGGAESFREGGYHRTPIGDLLPVYLDRGDDTRRGGEVRLELGREGWLQPWARLRSDDADERVRLEAMPGFKVLNVVRDVKPGASLVKLAIDEQGGAYPALVTQRYGRGRTAALLLGDIWRWGMRDTDSRRDMERAWRQLVRWLIADVPGRVELAVEPEGIEGSGAIRLQVRVRDAAFEPVDDATVMLKVERVVLGAEPGGEPGFALRAESSLDEVGLYEVVYAPRDPGAFRVKAEVSNASGVPLHEVEAGWSSEPALAEFRSLEPNRAALEDLASRTGGEVVSRMGLDALVRGLPLRQAPVMEAWTAPAWHTPWWFLLAIACFLAEWGLRRWKGLP